MNTTTILIVAVAVLAVLGAIVVLTAARRKDATGVLSRETRSRDTDADVKAKGRDYEREAVAARSTALAVPQSVAVAPFSPPDPEVIGVSCHGSQYNRVGEKKGGPAPRGMDHFAVSINNGSVVIDTGAVFGGAAIGTNTTGQESEGPHCVGSTGGH
ncbi:MAG: hypothetical protein EBY86_07775 [Acidimicrobiia bacterium]|nr:hypothetical protein [Acidimicrobiia bacterium]